MNNDNYDIEAIYNTYWDSVFRICYGYTGNSMTAKDLSQDAFINIFKALPDFKSNSKISTWIYRITSNVCLRYLEKSNKYKTVELSNTIVDTDNIIHDEDGVELLYKCISELSELDCLIISMELEEISQAEIAEVIGISPENVRVKIHRIKKKLELKLKKYGY